MTRAIRCQYPFAHRVFLPKKKTAASGFVSILPQLEEQELYDRLGVEIGGLWNRNVDDLSWYANVAKCEGIKQRPPVLACPSDQALPISQVYDPVEAATGSYALSNGSLGPDALLHIAKYENNGVFVYVARRKVYQLLDGLSNTILLGEVMLADTWESSNTWTYALVNADCLRSTTNPLNTHPGTGIAIDLQNGAFGSQHPGGGNFCFADGHVQFINDQVEMRLYRGFSTIAEGDDEVR